MKTYQDLLDELTSMGVLKEGTPLYDAYSETDRADFVRDEDKDNPYIDYPLRIGYDQTTSQPYAIAFMLDQLEVEKGSKVLEIGYGSGWQTVILSRLVGESGEVHATELVPELKEFGEQNIEKLSPENVYLYQAIRGKLGVKRESPFDRIIVGAAGDKVPEQLTEQLSNGGIIIMPVKNSIVRVEKDIDGKISISECPGLVLFVPLVI